MAELYLANSEAIAIVDDEDFPRISEYVWYLKPAKFGTCYVWRAGDKVLLHRFVLRLEKSRFPSVDHKDHDGLNNRKGNLRICTHAQNLQNRAKNKT